MEYSDGGGGEGRKKRFQMKFTAEQKEKMLGFEVKYGSCRGRSLMRR